MSVALAKTKYLAAIMMGVAMCFVVMLSFVSVASAEAESNGKENAVKVKDENFLYKTAITAPFSVADRSESFSTNQQQLAYLLRLVELLQMQLANLLQEQILETDETQQKTDRLETTKDRDDQAADKRENVIRQPQDFASEFTQNANRAVALLENEVRRIGPTASEQTCLAFYGPDINLGDVGVEVEKLQNFLTGQGFTIPIATRNGTFDYLTKNALMEYQNNVGAEVATESGTVGFWTRISIANACQKTFTDPDIQTVEGVCATNAPCEAIRPKGQMHGRINFYNPLEEVSVGEYVVVEGFYTTEKRSRYHGDDFRVQSLLSKTGIMDIEEGFGAAIDSWRQESDPNVIHIITTIIDCKPFQMQVTLNDGSIRVLDSDVQSGIKTCIEVNDAGRVVWSNNTEPVPVSRYYTFSPAQDVYAISVVVNRKDFVSE